MLPGRDTIVPMGHSRATSDRYRAAILLGVGETAVRIPARRRGLLGLAVLLNLVLFAIGVYFEVHPQDRHDRWSAAGVASIGVLNSAALSVPPGRALSHASCPSPAPDCVRSRTACSLVMAALFVALQALRHWDYVATHAAALLLPPVVTLLALPHAPRRS